jgi:hypothetical protein
VGKSSMPKGEPSRSASARTEPKSDSDAASSTGASPGPRMQQVLQAQIAPWRRDELSDEEAQLREIKRIPLRHVFDNDEARRRLVARAVSPGKKRFSKPKTASGS